VTVLVQAVEAAVTELAELLLSSALERVTAQLLEEAEEGSGEREVEPVEVAKPRPPRKADKPKAETRGRPGDKRVRALILAEVTRKPGSTMADVGRALGLRPEAARYHARHMEDDGLLVKTGAAPNVHWNIAGTTVTPATDDPAPATQRSERAPAPEAADPEAAILAHLRKSPASIEGIRRAVCPDWKEAPLGRLLHSLEARKLVEGRRGRAGLVTWRLKGAA
jgi:DNA-binding Lrp family transcriptional regulator